MKDFEKEIIVKWKSKVDPSRFANANVSPKSAWVKGFLIDASEGFVGDMFRNWKRFVLSAHKEGAKIKAGSAGSFAQYLWLLRKLNLIHLSRSEPSKTRSPILKNFYKLNRSKLDDVAWQRPLQTLYPKSDSKLRRRKREQSNIPK